METKLIKPVDGFKIRDPQTKAYLPEEGRLVEMSSYWYRRIQDGTVTIADSSPVLKNEKLLKKGSDA